jgi:hypothetical protein
MDDKKFSGDRDKNNHERFQKHGKDWWYWTRSGHWSYYRGGQWYDYDEDSYVDTATSRGPFYEDQNGFFFLDGNRKIYDPQIHRGTRGSEGPVSFVPGSVDQSDGPPSPPPN